MYTFVITALCVLVYYVYTKLKNVYTYWEMRGIKGPKPEFPYGNVKTVMSKQDSMSSLVGRIYKEFPEDKVIGIYQGLTPILIVKDPDLVKKIIVKDFAHFTDRGLRINNDPFARNLLSLDGDEWKMLRQKLTPLFSTGKLKQMMPLLDNAVKEYMQYLDKLVERHVPLEARELNMKYTLKTITSVAFGLDIDTFSEEKNQFLEMAEKIFKPRRLLQRLAILIDGIFPGIFMKIPIVFSSKSVRSFFSSLVSQIVENREGKPKTRKDFMDLMIELKEQGSLTKTTDDAVTELKITQEIIVAQALLFYAAGFETSAGSMAFLMYELAKNQEIQNRCYEEIKGVMKNHNGKMTYEALSELEYTNMAFDEALRMHSVGTILLRKCVEKYEVAELNLTIEKETKLFIPSLAMHHDERFYPEPEKFDPERFSQERKVNINAGTYLPFGDGPRNCIGLRFAKVQSLLGLAHFLYNYRLKPSENTPMKMKYDPTGIVLKSSDGIMLNIERRVNK